MKSQQKINQFLKQNQDLAYRSFTQKIVTSSYPLLGVRSPILKKFAKELIKDEGKWYHNYPFQYFEELALYAYSLGFLKEPFQEVIQEIQEFLPYIDNWAINDYACASLKQFKKNQKEGFEFILWCLKQEQPYTVRFGLVLLLDFYINDTYIDQVLKLCNNNYMDHYYVSMAHSWLISICYIKYPKKTIQFLEHAKIRPWVYQKAISKIGDSRRVTNEEKEMLKQMKKKLLV